MNRFAVIDCSKEKKKDIARKLITSVVNKSMVFTIVKTTPDLFENFKYKKIRLSSNFSYSLYLIDNVNKIEDGINYLSGISLWHKPIFHILIGGPDFPNKLKDYLSRNKNVTIDKLENDLKDDIIGFVDPLDDDLEFYGKDEVRNMIKEIAPEAIIDTK